MAPQFRIRTLAAAGAGVALLAQASSAQNTFQHFPGGMPSGSPFNTGYTENVDFGDVDGDTDLDAVLANGGDFGNQQSRIWINRGFEAGGTLGVFADRTSAQFPTVALDSRDIEFADIDNDGDLDIYLSNTSQISNQSNRWWINMGGAQTGTQGFYQDQTAAHWQGLGAAGSSIAATQVLGSGGFIDFSCDCDFADLDNDGDLDMLVTHTTAAPTLYRNTCAGRHWIGFSLVGATCRDAVGARVRIRCGECGEQPQMREVSITNAFAAQGDRRLLFGLGACAHPQTVWVTWPGEAAHRVGELAPDRYHALTQPAQRAAR